MPQLSNNNWIFSFLIFFMNLFTLFALLNFFSFRICTFWSNPISVSLLTISSF